jgi:hypothetical protein
MAVSRAETGTGAPNTRGASTPRVGDGAPFAGALEARRSPRRLPAFLDPGLSAGERAAQLGYGDGPEAVLAMQRWHDATHVIACRLLGLPYSPTLHWAASGAPAHPTRHADAVGVEEEVTLALQCFVQTGERTGPLRIFFLLGWEEESITAAVRNAVEAER